MTQAGRATQVAVILTAIETETRAVLRHFPERDEEVVQGTVFHLGQFDKWRIAVAEVGTGNPTAAAIAERAIRHFDPGVYCSSEWQVELKT
jgi:nucleoside phosphorylase